MIRIIERPFPTGRPGLKKRDFRPRRIVSAKGWLAGAIKPVLLLALFLAGCSAPLTVEALGQQAAYRRLNGNALGNGRLSETTLVVLQRHDLAKRYSIDPMVAIATLHTEVVQHPEVWSEFFALAELSYLQATRDHSVSQYMATALYAYAFLFPNDVDERPNPYDPRFRQACDLYNFSLAAAFPPSESGELTLAPGRYALPFGTLDMVVDQGSIQWGGSELTGFKPTGTLKVTGLQNQYRSAGIGAPMAARLARPPVRQDGFQVAPRLRIPTTLLLSVASPRKQIASGHVAGTLALFNLFDTGSIMLSGERVPLEYNQTATLAVSLAETAIWKTELRGFLKGTMLDQTQPRLVSIEPHRAGRMPVVLVHGTASSPFRWADMINDLLEDPQIRDHFEFWIFTYETGNPIPYSAFLLRDALHQAIASLGSEATDPALDHVVLIGHSQGGLLAKMLVIDPGDQIWNRISSRPLNDLKLEAESRNLLRRALFPMDDKQIDRVIFIATPHRGSYLAAFSAVRLVGRLVTLPLSVSKAGAELFMGNKDVLNIDPSTIGLGSIYGMTPGSPFIKALADIPVTPRVRVNSIIPVQGNGPAVQGDDGVVTYESAHIEGAESELVVRSGHSTQSNPVTIEEVRRILLMQLGMLCPEGNCSRTSMLAN